MAGAGTGPPPAASQSVSPVWYEGLRGLNAEHSQQLRRVHGESSFRKGKKLPEIVSENTIILPSLMPLQVRGF